MDRDFAEKLKLKYGLQLTLVAYSSFLSVLGILVSILGIIGCIVGATLIFNTEQYIMDNHWNFNPITMEWTYEYQETSRRNAILGTALGVTFILNILYLIMWIFLKIKTSQRDTIAMERIGTIYSYLVSALEFLGTMIFIGIGIHLSHSIIHVITQVVIPFIYLFFIGIKLSGIADENNKMLQHYLRFCWTLFFISVIFLVGLSMFLITLKGYSWTFFLTTVSGYLFFFLNTGPVVIVYNIRVNKQSSAVTEEPANIEEHIKVISPMTSSWENDVAGTSKERVFLTSLDRHFCQAQVQVQVRWGSWHGPGIILESVIAKLQLNSRLNLHFKSIQLLQELSWSYALYLVFTYRLLLPAYRLQLQPTILLFWTTKPSKQTPSTQVKR